MEWIDLEYRNPEAGQLVLLHVIDWQGHSTQVVVRCVGSGHFVEPMTHQTIYSKTLIARGPMAATHWSAITPPE